MRLLLLTLSFSPASWSARLRDSWHLSFSFSLTLDYHFIVMIDWLFHSHSHFIVSPQLSTFNGVVIINCHNDNITPYYRTTQLKTNHSSRIENCLFYYLSTETACFGDREITLMAPSFPRLPTSSSSQSTTDWGSLVSHTITKKLNCSHSLLISFACWFFRRVF